MTRLSTLSRSIRDQVVIVTGGASGMGRATAHLLADEGAQVGLVDRSGDALEQVAAEIRAAGGTVHAVTAASKSGVVGLTRGLAVELGPDGVTANCICPGPINTGMTAPIPEEHKAKYAKRHTALRRYGEPEEVAHITLALLLPSASYITGAVIPVDGGLTIRNA